MFEEIRKALFPTPVETMAKVAEYEKLTGVSYGLPSSVPLAVYVKLHGVETRTFQGARHDN